MKNGLILIIMLTLSAAGAAQKHPYEVKFSYQIESDLAAGKIYPTRAGLLYSLIGDYYNSNQYSDIPVSWGVDRLDLDEHTTRDALPFIIEKAKEHSIVIISENHLKPQHRIFASETIRELSKIGFKHLGLETFANISNKNTLLDETLSARGYPLNSPLTGTYTLEPSMGILVRNAIALDYDLFAYEESEKIKGKDRDEIQADNIVRYLENNPNARIIIVCGLHHAIESNKVKRDGVFWMANYLTRKLSIDPLTIYQDNFTEKFIENEHPALKNLRVRRPSVFVDENGEMVKLTEHVDIEVIHPKTIYMNGRPDWLYRDQRYRPVAIKLKTVDQNFPRIISAFPQGERNSVPVDRIELKHKHDNKVLILKQGSYRITMYDGEKTEEYIQTVD